MWFHQFHGVYLKVVCPANFDNHKLTQSTSDKLLEKGFYVGLEIMLDKRVTAEFGPDKIRKDVKEGTRAVITGVVDGSDNKAVVRFEAEVSKQIMYSDHMLDLDRIKLIPKAATANDSGTAGKGNDRDGAVPGSIDALPKHMKWLANEKSSTIEIVSGWERSQTFHDQKVLSHHFGATCGFLLNNVLAQMPKYSEKDILIVKRDAKYELYTARDFPANTLVLAADSTEIKFKFWTFNRCALLGNGRLSPSGHKHAVLDGRIRGTVNVPLGEGKSFALFWLVDRVEEKKSANLKEGIVTQSMNVQMSMPFKTEKTKLTMLDGDLPQVPLLFNPTDIKKHTRLCVLMDAKLKGMAEAQVSTAMKEKEDADKDKKTKKRKGDDVEPEAEANSAAAKKFKMTSKTPQPQDTVAACKASGKVANAAAAKAKAAHAKAIATPNAVVVPTPASGAAVVPDLD